MHNLHIFRNHTCQLDKVPPLDNGTLVTFVNNGLYAMIEQLNTFACYVESRMITLNRQIDTCYSNLVILEMKLNSINIPGDHQSTTTNNVNQVAASEAVNTPRADGVSASNATVNEPAPDELDTNENTVGDVDNTVKGEEENVHSEETQDNSEELDKYRRMLKIGVHGGAVRQKMLLEGIDPARLNL